VKAVIELLPGAGPTKLARGTKQKHQELFKEGGL
jgi:hypothetical protein